MDELLEHNFEFDQKHTFQPELCERSERLVRGKFSDSGAHPLSFLERQSALERRKEQRKRQAKLRLSAERDCTFQPETGNADELLRHVRPQRLAETAEARVERLSARDAKRIKARRKRAEEEKYVASSAGPRAPSPSCSSSSSSPYCSSSSSSSERSTTAHSRRAFPLPPHDPARYADTRNTIIRRRLIKSRGSSARRRRSRRSTRTHATPR